MKRSEWSGFIRQLLMQWYSDDSPKLPITQDYAANLVSTQVVTFVSL